MALKERTAKRFVKPRPQHEVHVAMKSRTLIVSLLALFMLSACESAENNPKQTVGTLVGAGLGALAGSQIGGGRGQLAAVAIGAVAGGLFGSEIGKSLDKADKMHLERTTQNSLEYNKAGQTSTWRNPDSGNAGSVTPTSTYKSANGKDCREYKTKIVVDGKEETGTGRACRDAEGNWRLVS